MAQGDVIIKDWEKGIADSPHLGFADIRNADIFTIPGIIRANSATSKASSTTVTDSVRWIVKNPTGNYYALGEAGKLYKSTDGTSWAHVSGNTTTSSSANGLAYWKDHIFVARDAKLDVLKCADDTWYNDWQSLTSDTDWHPMIVGQDDILYIGNGRYVATVGDDFAAGAPPTATFTAQALDLPTGYRIKCMTELGKWLMLGTIRGTSSAADRGADIFPWDRSSGSFELPIKINDYGVHQMVTVGNLVYAVVGLRGSVYVTNNSSFKLLRKLPESLVTNGTLSAGIFLNFFPGAIMHHRNRIYFGVSSGTTGASIADALGVWSLGEDGTLVFEHKISTGTMDADTNLHIGALLPTGSDTYLIGWIDSTDEGIDIVTTNRFSSYDAYVISPLIPVGTALNKRTFQQIEFSLAKPLAADQAVRLSYRKDLTNSFTSIGDFTFATVGAVLSHNAPANIPDAEYIQIRIELDGTGIATPELKEIRLR